MIDPVRPLAPMPIPLQADYGADWSLAIQLCNPDVNGNPDTTNPINLTGYTVTAAIKDDSSANSPVVLPITVSVTNALLGKLTLSLTNAQLISIPSGEYEYYVKGAIGAVIQYFMAETFTIIGH